MIERKHLTKLLTDFNNFRQVITEVTRIGVVKDGVIMATLLMEDILHIMEEDITEHTTQNTEDTLTGVMIKEEGTKRSGIGIKHMDPRVILQITVVITLLIIMELKRVIMDIILTELMVMQITVLLVITEDIIREGKKVPVITLDSFLTHSLFSFEDTEAIGEDMDRMVIMGDITVTEAIMDGNKSCHSRVNYSLAL